MKNVKSLIVLTSIVEFSLLKKAKVTWFTFFGFHIIGGIWS